MGACLSAPVYKDRIHVDPNESQKVKVKEKEIQFSKIITQPEKETIKTVTVEIEKSTVEIEKSTVESQRCDLVPSDRYLYRCELKEKEKEKEKENNDMKIRTIYQQCNEENTPAYSYKNLRTLIKVLRVVDGDTLDICLLHEETGKTFKHRVRLYGIDTPEKRPLKNNPNRDKEIAASKLSSQAMKDKLAENDNMVIALFYDPDKYGRLLCSIYDKNGEDINEWMIKSGHAYSYFGKTKKGFDEVCQERDNE